MSSKSTFMSLYAGSNTPEPEPKELLLELLYTPRATCVLLKINKQTAGPERKAFRNSELAAPSHCQSHHTPLIKEVWRRSVMEAEKPYKAVPRSAARLGTSFPL